MLGKFYRASVLVYPCQFNRVHCCPYFSTGKASALPPPTLSAFGNYYTVKRYFRSYKKAHAWAAYIVTSYRKGSRENPILKGGQLTLF
jgi:hypothetical protein